ncbi:hypothetical protein E2C01_064490 [Portunus trituberculatus]|uniref:Uncharacterized protein n=1 Tax=Portunus trituberculatus TaxID=210409 RepID=A0A5B7HND0_PORTR|nr:hypothetical protein [Portunus trituberculatus]
MSVMALVPVCGESCTIAGSAMGAPCTVHHRRVCSSVPNANIMSGCSSQLPFLYYIWCQICSLGGGSCRR